MKKLLTNDSKLVEQVENVLKESGVPCARVQLHAEKDKDNILLVTTNYFGNEMRNAIDNATKTDGKHFYFGVLRNHPEYTVPKGIQKELSEEGLIVREERRKEAEKAEKEKEEAA